MPDQPGRGDSVWAEPVQDYLDHIQVERGLSTNTVAAYRRDLAAYVTYLNQAQVAGPEAITPVLVAGFATALRHRGLATSSINRMVVAVRGLHRFWASEAITATDPAHDVEPPAIGQRLPKALAIDQVMALIAAAGAEGPEAGPVELRDGALLELLYGTGARISEVTALDVDEIRRLLGDDDLGLTLVGKGGKTRVVPVGHFARAALEAWLVRGRPALARRSAQPSPALFLNARGGRLSRQSAFHRIHQVATRAGLAADISPHTLRHSYATHLIDGGADVRVVQELLGHASVATTQIYTLITVDHLREVYRMAHPRAL
ncbi:MAG: site-specific tyrosine recombinase XerD [Propionibacteriaceae bacterium]|nr:site-specific tyrosine recombinase XerD [Propionibacteriaceae bacterium]